MCLHANSFQTWEANSDVGGVRMWSLRRGFKGLSSYLILNFKIVMVYREDVCHAHLMVCFSSPVLWVFTTPLTCVRLQKEPWVGVCVPVCATDAEVLKTLVTLPLTVLRLRSRRRVLTDGLMSFLYRSLAPCSRGFCTFSSWPPFPGCA